MAPNKIVDGINIYDRSDYNEWYEAEYRNTTEPWAYSRRAAELYRHIYSVQKVRQYYATPQNVLELGCSKGLMTELLIPYSGTIYAADISLSALKACKKRCQAITEKSNGRVNYFVTTAPGLPFAANSFDVVTICDGIAEWNLEDAQKQLVIEDVYRVLKKGGIAIFTDCLMPELDKNAFDAYITFIMDSSFSIADVSYLYDKPWYKLESLLKKAGLSNTFRRLLSSTSLAKTLNNAGRLFGRQASRHIVLTATKK